MHSHHAIQAILLGIVGMLMHIPSDLLPERKVATCEHKLHRMSGQGKLGMRQERSQLTCREDFHRSWVCQATCWAFFRTAAEEWRHCSVVYEPPLLTTTTGCQHQQGRHHAGRIPHQVRILRAVKVCRRMKQQLIHGLLSQHLLTGHHPRLSSMQKSLLGHRKLEVHRARSHSATELLQGVFLRRGGRRTSCLTPLPGRSARLPGPASSGKRRWSR